MGGLRNALIALMALCIGLQIAACTTLAVTGDKRYKAELNSVLLSVTSDLDKDGAVSARTHKKLDDILAKYASTYGSKGSYIDTKKMADSIKEAEADPNPASAFQKLEVAKTYKTEAEGFLTTEIKE